MLLSPTVHAVLLGAGLLAIPVAGLLLRKRVAGAAALLWLIPLALTLSAGDLILAGLEGVRPGTAYDAAPGGGFRLAFACLVALPPVEIFYQRIVTRLAGGGPHMKAPDDWGEETKTTEPGDDG